REALPDYLARHGIVGIAGVDTRSLTRHIRDHGAQLGAIGTEDARTLRDRALAAPPMAGQDLTQRVSTPEILRWQDGLGPWRLGPTADADLHVVAMDFGVKRSILRCLVESGCRVTLVPAATSAEEILSLAPDGIFLSNGPGDPAAVTRGVATVRDLLGKRPLFG